ncbi:MAG: hypothetical protein HYX48_05210 [Chlamydiales bacterium]|nr:hypothetical protein [Chlamydiales bacterium]
MQPHVLTNGQSDAHQATFSVDGHVNGAHLQETVLAQPVRKNFSLEERAGFYSGEDRLTLQNHNVLRVRELQEMNDNLQRDIARKEKLISGASDPLALSADIEHAKIMIARNTGEVLKIHTEDEERRRRIAELEAQNIKLRADMVTMQSRFITDHDPHSRTRHAADFFLSKSKFENNIAELIELGQL